LALQKNGSFLNRTPGNVNRKKRFLLREK